MKSPVKTLKKKNAREKNAREKNARELEKKISEQAYHIKLLEKLLNELLV